MKKVIAAVAAVLAVPLGWLVYESHDLSVRWGTSDPCEMVAERKTEQTYKDLDPLGTDRLLALDRPGLLAHNVATMRKAGAITCWKSMLFDMPTSIEVNYPTVHRANSIEADWARGKETRWLALRGAFDAEVPVLSTLLLSGHTATVVQILRAVLAEYPDKRADIEAAVEDRCQYEYEKRAVCIQNYFLKLGLPEPKEGPPS